MDKLQITTDDLEEAKKILIDRSEYDATKVVNWLDYMIAGMEQAVKMQEKVWTTKE